MGLLQRVKALSAANAAPSPDQHASTMTTSTSSPTTAPEPVREEVREEVTQLTADDKVLGPNAPVPDLLATQPLAPSEKNSVPAGGGSHTDTEHGDTDKELEIAPESGNPEEKQVAEASNEEKKDEEDKEEEEEEEEEEDDTIYPGGAALAILTFGLCMATFVVALDNTIIGIRHLRTRTIKTKSIPY